MSEKGDFIVIEGIGGCGKDTQVMRIADYIRSRGVELLVTREHTRDTPPGRTIERVIKGAEEPMDPLALQLLYVSDRRNHFVQTIGPHLDLGVHVLGNRYYATTVAYCPEERRPLILKLNKDVVPSPALTMIIDTDPEVAVARVGSRGDPDIFDKVENLVKCRKGYEWYAQNSGDEVAWIDGNGTIEQVTQKMLEEISRRKLIKGL